MQNLQTGCWPTRNTSSQKKSSRWVGDVVSRSHAKHFHSCQVTLDFSGSPIEVNIFHIFHIPQGYFTDVGAIMWLKYVCVFEGGGGGAQVSTKSNRIATTKQNTPNINKFHIGITYACNNNSPDLLTQMWVTQFSDEGNMLHNMICWTLPLSWLLLALLVICWKPYAFIFGGNTFSAVKYLTISIFAPFMNFCQFSPRAQTICPWQKMPRRSTMYCLYSCSPEMNKLISLQMTPGTSLIYRCNLFEITAWMNNYTAKLLWGVKFTHSLTSTIAWSNGGWTCKTVERSHINGFRDRSDVGLTHERRLHNLASHGWDHTCT